MTGVICDESAARLLQTLCKTYSMHCSCVLFCSLVLLSIDGSMHPLFLFTTSDLMLPATLQSPPRWADRSQVGLVLCSHIVHRSHTAFVNTQTQHGGTSCTTAVPHWCHQAQCLAFSHRCMHKPPCLPGCRVLSELVTHLFLTTLSDLRMNPLDSMDAVLAAAPLPHPMVLNNWESKTDR
jgi:hypothetical protein